MPRVSSKLNKNLQKSFKSITLSLLHCSIIIEVIQIFIIILKKFTVSSAVIASDVIIFRKKKTFKLFQNLKLTFNLFRLFNSVSKIFETDKIISASVFTRSVIILSFLSLTFLFFKSFKQRLFD